MRSPKDYLIAFLALSTMAAAGIAWQLNRKLDELQALAQTAADDRAAWQQRIADAEKRRSELETELGTLREQVADIPPEAGGAPGESAPSPRPGPRDSRGNPGRSFAAMMEHPEFAKAWTTRQKAQLDTRYADLFRRLNLSPAELEQFKNLLVEKQTAMMDVMAAARAEGISGREGRDQLRQLVQQTQAEVDQSIRAMLGDAGYTQYQGYEQTMPQRNTVNQLEQRLSYSSTPLQAAQVDQLVQILAETSSRPSTGVDVGPGTARFFGAGGTITDEALTRAQGVLSQAQLAALQQLQAEQQAQRQMSEAFRNARTNRGSPSSSATPPPPGGG